MQVRLGKFKGLEALTAFMERVKRGHKKVALRAAGEWFIGNMQRGLMHYQGYKYVSRKAAYGQTFVSDKQRRYVMARIREGSIDPGAPHRTGNTQRAWSLHENQNNVYIINPTAGAYYTRHDSGQARQLGMAGWLKAMKVMQNNVKGAIRHAQSVLNAWIKAQK